MWNLSFEPPRLIESRVLTAMPAALRGSGRSAWADANKPGHHVDGFIEGPVFDAAGNLYVTDIPSGRILRIDTALRWHEVADTGGWPNGLALHADGSLWAADYRRGLLRIDPRDGRVDVLLGHRNSEGFKGLNDLVFAPDGSCLFTDQGQTGLHDPTGRVYRLAPDGRLDVLLANGPSPNGIALDAAGRTLFVAMTRANAVWRGPLLPDGAISKVGAFRTFFGTSGPDGLAMLPDGRLVVAHASLGGAFVLDPRGQVTHLIRSAAGGTVTNVAPCPGGREVVLTESETGSVLIAPLP